MKVEAGLSFSKHAERRLNERKIDMDGSFRELLENTAKKVGEKGARNVAVIGNKEVFIVNVPNQVVVTAMAREEMSGQIFTNIDSAVLISR